MTFEITQKQLNGISMSNFSYRAEKEGKQITFDLIWDYFSAILGCKIAEEDVKDFLERRTQ